jgi:REP element-mobilizing transposase RayT
MTDKIISLPKRQSIRLQQYDYSQAGGYFITICTQNKECMFGEIVDGKMQLNDIGQVVQQCWDDIPVHFPHIELDAFVVMPNHIHGIVVVADNILRRGTACRAQDLNPTMERFRQPVAGSIPTVIRSFKAAVTKNVNELRQTPGVKLWQRNYWEHVIRNEPELNQLREYINFNPERWELDRLYMQHAKRQDGHGMPCPYGSE